jgi:NAD(P)-dependent dehydrogenase (short-subunit alcohol dehydrogenase family)
MSKTILIVGYGPGISSAVADTFAGHGFSVGLVARSADRLAAGVAALREKGAKAEAFTADASDPEAMRKVVRDAQAKLGPIDVLQWTAYTGGAGDLTTADSAAVRGVLDIATVGLLAAVQESLADLRARKGSVLVTNGGLGLFDDGVDGMGVTWNAMGLSVANAAKHKMVRLLAKKLAPDGVHVGEVMVTGVVKGTAFDKGNGTIEPSSVAAKFWDLHEKRAEHFTRA